MKKIVIILVFCLAIGGVFAQNISSGIYGNGLHLAYNNKTNKVTGYFEEYSGWNKNYTSAQFSCVFYLEGILVNNKAIIKTYYPNDTNQVIEGFIEVVDNKSIKVKLNADHGGCWNVQNFANDTLYLNLEGKQLCKEIKYVTASKTNIYNNNGANKKSKNYLVKNNFVSIERVEGNWAYCQYVGNKTIKGWIKLSDLNEASF